MTHLATVVWYSPLSGFKIWTFQGALVANVERPKLYQVS